MFTKKPSEHIEDTEGKLVKMEGRVSGSQPISVSWFKDDTEIHSSDKYDISFKSNVAVLCIKSSLVADSGKYSCKASNEAGQASCDITLGVSGGFNTADANTPSTDQQAALYCVCIVFISKHAGHSCKVICNKKYWFVLHSSTEERFKSVIRSKQRNTIT